jgi:hypothetical protein
VDLGKATAKVEVGIRYLQEIARRNPATDVMSPHQEGRPLRDRKSSPCSDSSSTLGSRGRGSCRRCTTRRTSRCCASRTASSGCCLSGSLRRGARGATGLSVQHGKNRQGETNATGESPPKRRRGRPRKQV